MAMRFGSAVTVALFCISSHPAAVTGVLSFPTRRSSDLARFVQCSVLLVSVHAAVAGVTLPGTISQVSARPEEHTSEPQSLMHAVCLSVPVIVKTGWSPVLYVPASGVLTTFTSAHV